MTSPMTRMLRGVLAPAVLFSLVPVVHGATLYAANNGVDGPTCGTSASPCRSITRAVANAADGDTIMVRPGRYTADLDRNGILGEPGEEVPALGAMLVIYKPLSILSTDGAAATIIDARAVDANANVLIVTGDAEFGRPDHGFTVTNTAKSSGAGIAPQGTNLKVRGNQVVGRIFDPAPPVGSPLVSVGIDAEALPYVILIEGNQIMGWDVGIHIRAADQIASKNHITFFSRNGIVAEGGHVVGNVVVGSDLGSAGLELASAASAIGNAVHGNLRGIQVRDSFTGVIQKNNIFGNYPYGLFNAGAAAVIATHNYWGAPTGPGLDPADFVVNGAGATTTTTPFATTRFSINPSAEP